MLVYILIKPLKLLRLIDPARSERQGKEEAAASLSLSPRERTATSAEVARPPPQPRLRSSPTHVADDFVTLPEAEVMINAMVQAVDVLVATTTVAVADAVVAMVLANAAARAQPTPWSSQMRSWADAVA